MSGKATLKNFKTMLAGAKLPERTVEICLLSDLVQAHEAAVEELEQAQKDTANSLAGTGAPEIAERIQVLEAQMRDNVYPLLLRALPAPQFRAFKAEHPIRFDEEGQPNRQDLVFTFNADTGFEPLIRLSIVDPEIDDEMWAQLMSALTEGQFDKLGATAWMLNRGEISIPFSPAASALMLASADE